ncbi:unnamed protein product [Arctogadus glacialis]
MKDDCSMSGLLPGLTSVSMCPRRSALPLKPSESDSCPECQLYEVGVRKEKGTICATERGMETRPHRGRLVSGDRLCSFLTTLGHSQPGVLCLSTGAHMGLEGNKTLSPSSRHWKAATAAPQSALMLPKKKMKKYSRRKAG